MNQPAPPYFPATRLAQQVASLLPENGVKETAIPGLHLVRASKTGPRSPVVYTPSLYVVAQGSKRAYLGNETFTYDALNYLVLTVPLPLEAGIVAASEEEPYLAIKLDLDLALLNELLLDLESNHANASDKPIRGIYVSRLDTEICDAIRRLLKTLEDAHRTRVLAPMIIKEVFYYLLAGEQGEVLRSFARRDRHNYQIASVLNYIQKHYAQPLEVAHLADIANMSPSSLHQHFKTITQTSPKQYIKTIRLHQARRLIMQDDQNVSEAAFQVGYSSPSQFSREYKRLFGEAPSRDMELS